MCQDITERRKLAKDLLSKVRLPLLSTPAVNEVLIRVLSSYHECSNITEAVLNDKEQLNKTICNITSRYSNQTNFNTLVCGGNNVNISKISNDVNNFDANNLSEVNKPVKKPNPFLKQFVLKVKFMCLIALIKMILSLGQLKSIHL